MKIYASTVEQGIQTPCFFVQMIPFGFTSHNIYHQAKNIHVDIHYVPDTYEDIKYLTMFDDLSDMFKITLHVEDRAILIDNNEMDVIDKIGHFQFELNFIDSVEVDATLELMQELIMEEEI
jgi:hypothetical protein